MRLFVETIWLAELHILRETTFNKFPVVAYLFLEIPGKHQFGISKETAVFVKYRSTVLVKIPLILLKDYCSYMWTVQCFLYCLNSA